MAKVIGNVVAPTGKYIKDGEEKTRWMRCGVLMETDNGMRLKLEALPLIQADQGLWFSIFEPDEGKGQSTGNKPAQRAAQKEQDDIPF